MKHRKTTIALGLASVLAVSCSSAERSPATPAAHFTETVNAQQFYRGNVHTHTTRSDGNMDPVGVIGWYKSHGYDFLAVTPMGAVEMANKQIAEAHADGGVALLNHPNFYWALPQDDLLKIDGFEILEIASGHHLVNEAGNSTHPSEEELWDTYLSQKHRVYGAGVDDTHEYHVFNDKVETNPGRVWIQVWAPKLEEHVLCEALRTGHFYTARNSKISALVVTPSRMELAVDDWQPSTDHVDFIGAGGQLLERVFTNPARYTLRGGEGYVRAHVFQERKDGRKHEALTQAYFIKND
ncbi:MAG: hypothetical protein HY075_08900 [Deltaproteobacteria bacterium]|nr:hypothetical protein [Deltaproteobacteria bacterium]